VEWPCRIRSEEYVHHIDKTVLVGVVTDGVRPSVTVAVDGLGIEVAVTISVGRTYDNDDGLYEHDDLPVEWRRALATPALSAVASRVNTGKSTLVNNLISAKIAATSAQEATALLGSRRRGFSALFKW
jgi:hypothetical protein